MNRYLCIHGHFYQPPRENPWLEAIEQQDSAYPFHDWNERIAAECYRPNSAARILDEQRRIARIVNNYTRTSFNFGPTLLSWLERCDPETYHTIVAADAASRERFGGHGSALAQAYNHIILPLASERDKRTQVAWGIADFEHRFGRPPEGMWLPETAVDTATLEALAAAGIAFTVLAPHQAGRVRPLGATSWQPLPPTGIDTRRPYLCRLPSGGRIALFFYAGAIANEIAFRGLLKDGEQLATRLLTGFGTEAEAQLMHVATDGETYGHHHRFGEMALAYALDRIEARGQATLTVYGEFLAKYPPTHEVEVVENSSWSCAHGIERWRSDCGCHIGGEPGWTQAWRAPLRAAFDWLRDALEPLFVEGMKQLGCEPWAARDAFIAVILDRDPQAVAAFLRAQAGRELDPEESTRALRLLEMQRHALLMYTSCGWFFDEVSGIETTQLLAYAGRAIQLAEETCGAVLEEEFRRRLAAARSNLPRRGDAARIYREEIATARVDLPRVAAHHAIAAGFAEPCALEDPHCHDIHCYTAEHLERREYLSGRLRLAVGRSRVCSTITWYGAEFCFAVLDLGGHNLTAGIRLCRDGESAAALAADLATPFERSDIPTVIRQLDHHFGIQTYNLWHLFRDEQRHVLQQIMAPTLAAIEASFREIYRDQEPLLRFLHDIRMPVPRLLAAPVERVLVERLRTLLESRQLHPGELKEMAEELAKLDIALDEPLLALAAGRQFEHQLQHLARTPQNLAQLLTIIETLEAVGELPLHPDLWRAQNLFWALRHTLDQTQQPEEWRAAFRRLGDCLEMATD